MSLETLRDDIIADGIVDADEVALLNEELYADGVIDLEEATVLFEINDAVSGNDNSPEWEAFFVRAITDAVLADDTTPGVIDDEEADFLIEKILADGNVDNTERALLSNIRQNATSIAPALEAKLVELGL